MLTIRFQRVGRKNDPAFRIVVTEKRSKPKSAGIERLGSYHPKTKATVLNQERILYWISKGAKLSDTAHNLLVSKGVIREKKRGVVPPSKSRKDKEKPAGPGPEGVVAEKPPEEKPEKQPEEKPEEKPTEEAPAAEEKPIEEVKPVEEVGEKAAPTENKPAEGKTSETELPRVDKTIQKA